MNENPDPHFLTFLDFRACLLFKEFLAFLSVFPSFSKDFRGSEEMENPCFLGGFPCLFPKKPKKIREVIENLRLANFRSSYRGLSGSLDRRVFPRVSPQVSPKAGVSKGVSHKVSPRPFRPRARECPKSVPECPF